MKLLFLSMHYKPEPCDTRTSQLAAGMVELGHKSTVISSFPNYPFGKVYAGYRQKICQKEKIDGVNVMRVPMFPDHSKSKKRRALSYLSFGFSSAFLGALFTRRPNLIWIHHPPLTTGIAGYIIAKIKRVPFVYEIHDLWPQTLMSTGMIAEGKVTRAIQHVCDFLHRRAAAIVVTSAGMKAQLVADGLDGNKIYVFHQWAPDESSPCLRGQFTADKYGLNGRFNVMFTGNTGVAQGLDTVLDAAKRLSDEPKLQITIVGAGVELTSLQQRVVDEKISNVRFTGHVTHVEVQELLPWADALLVHLKNDPLFEITIPSKTQSYLAAGRPILCGVNGDTAKVVSESYAGPCFDSEDSEAMAGAIRDLIAMPTDALEQLGLNARHGYMRSCSKAKLLARYEMLFADILDIPLQPNFAVIESFEEAKTSVQKAS
jgi:colanic acid biosynthesis glycosyl transferase WcaI